jgi:hypothetical protein
VRQLKGPWKVKDIHKKATVKRAYAANDTQLEMDAAKLRLRAERRRV